MDLIPFVKHFFTIYRNIKTNRNLSLFSFFLFHFLTAKTKININRFGICPNAIKLFSFSCAIFHRIGWIAFMNWRFHDKKNTNFVFYSLTHKKMWNQIIFLLDFRVLSFIYFPNFFDFILNVIVSFFTSIFELDLLSWNENPHRFFFCNLMMYIFFYGNLIVHCWNWSWIIFD